MCCLTKQVITGHCHLTSHYALYSHAYLLRCDIGYITAFAAISDSSANVIAIPFLIFHLDIIILAVGDGLRISGGKSRVKHRFYGSSHTYDVPA